MLKNNIKNRKESGFTIIEVLIVLAIAALILVVVLIAIPNLQRNQRNSARKTEAAHILTAAQSYISNNNGTNLTAGDTTAIKAIINEAGTLQQYTGLTQAATNNMTYGATAATPPKLTITNVAIASATGKTGEGIALDVGFVCDPATGPGATTATGATPRSVVLVYTLEATGGKFYNTCIGS